MPVQMPNISLSWEERQLIKSGLSLLVREAKGSNEFKDPIVVAKLMKKLNRVPACDQCKGAGTYGTPKRKCAVCGGSGLGVAY